MSENKSDIDAYIERYCRTRHITPEEAEQHALVKEVRAYYEAVAKEV